MAFNGSLQSDFPRHSLMTKPKKNLLVILFVILMPILFIPTIFMEFMKPYHIPAGSMIPTILIGDNLFVSKTAYKNSQPKLGDVAVFRSVVKPDTDFIKRVIGAPGDRIQMKEGILYINDVPCPVEPAGEYETVNDDGTVSKVPQYIETLPNGLKHPILKQVPFGTARMDNTPVYEVPIGHYFVMGDNRDASNDSRVQGLIGYIPLKNFVGRASFIYFSTGGHSPLWAVWKWPSTAHYDRIFQGIH
jgi:signal peptidase I